MPARPVRRQESPGPPGAPVPPGGDRGIARAGGGTGTPGVGAVAAVRGCQCGGRVGVSRESLGNPSYGDASKLGTSRLTSPRCVCVGAFAASLSHPHDVVEPGGGGDDVSAPAVRMSRSLQVWPSRCAEAALAARGSFGLEECVPGRPGLPAGLRGRQCRVGSRGRQPGLFEGSPAILTFPHWPPPPPPSPVPRLIIN